MRIDESGDRDPDYSLKYYVNGSFQNIADYNHSTGGFNLRGYFLDEMPNCHCCSVLSPAHSFVAERVKTVFSLWKRIIKCFPSTLHNIKMKLKNHQSVWIWFCGILRQWNHCFLGKTFQNVFLHTKTKSQSFQIPPVWRAFSKKPGPFLNGLVWTVSSQHSYHFCF